MENEKGKKKDREKGKEKDDDGNHEDDDDDEDNGFLSAPLSPLRVPGPLIQCLGELQIRNTGSIAGFQLRSSPLIFIHLNSTKSRFSVAKFWGMSSFIKL